MRSFRLRPTMVALSVPAILVLAFGTGLALFFQTHKPPPPLGLDSTQPAATVSPGQSAREDPCTPPAASSRSQLWMIQSGSLAGYRARELFSDIGDHEAVARTDHVHGFAVMERGVDFQRGVDFAKVDRTCISVEANDLTSIDALPTPLPEATRRDGHIPTLLDTANHPYVFFQAREFELPSDAFSGRVVTTRVSGRLSMRGRELDVNADLSGKFVNQEALVSGSILVHVPDWGMEVPGDPVVRPDVTIEFSLRFSHA